MWGYSQMKMRFLPCFLVLAACLPLRAQQPQTPAGKLTVDWAVPESPAFTVLGLTPQTVTRPSSSQQLATTLLNGIDQNGNFQSGIALDLQPYMLWYGHTVSYAKYRDSRATRFLSRAQLSVGSSKGATGDDKSARVALGLRLTLLDKGDPYLNAATNVCLANAGTSAIAAADPVPAPAASQSDKDAYTARMMAAYAPLERVCREKHQREYRRTGWNNSSLVIGGAPSWISTIGTTSDLKWNGAGVWTSYAYGFEGIPGLEDSSQLILHYRFRNKEQLPDPNQTGKFLEQDSHVFGARWRFGTADATGSLEYVFLHRDILGSRTDNSSRLSAAFERRVSGNIWFSFSFGTERGRADGANRAFVLTSFNWGFNRKEE